MPSIILGLEGSPKASLDLDCGEGATMKRFSSSFLIGDGQSASDTISLTNRWAAICRCSNEGSPLQNAPCPGLSQVTPLCPWAPTQPTRQGPPKILGFPFHLLSFHKHHRVGSFVLSNLFVFVCLVVCFVVFVCLSGLCCLFAPHPIPFHRRHYRRVAGPPTRCPP